jgi:hypothetical protein
VDKATARNDLTTAVPKFCLALEEHRRTPDGRVRSSQELLTHFFPHDGATSTDRLFKFMPNDVRGPILAAWGIRGAKAALRDDDAKVQSVIHDALVAGDLDHAGFEEGLTAEMVVRWAPLSDFWTFWRGGKLSKTAIQKALVTAYDLALFDAKWFLDTIDSRGGKLKGTDVLAEGLAKEDLIAWLRKVHESGDGSPRGLLAALGWDSIVAKTTNDVLIAVLDAMVIKVGLIKAAEGSTKSMPPPAATASPAAAPVAAAPTPSALLSVPPADIDWNEPSAKSGRPTAGPIGSGEVENMPTVSQSGDAQLAPAPMPAISVDGGEDIVVDDEVDLNDTGVGMQPAREDSPTSPRIVAAAPVEPEEEPPVNKPVKGLSKRPEPSSPPRPQRSR